MNVLLVCGSGLIGYYLLPLLVREGHRVTVVSRGNRALNHQNITHIKGERLDVFRRGIAGEYQAVIDNVAYHPKDCEMLLESLQGRMQKYIVTSTAFVYPNLEEAMRFPARPFRESDAQFVEELPEIIPANPHEQYVYDKQRMERWLRVHAEHFGVHTTVIRPLLQIVGANTDDGRFAWFWMRVRDGGQIWLPEETLHKAGPCQLSFAGDVAQTIVAAIYSEPHSYAVYNSGQPEIWTYEEYIRLMGRVAGTKPEICYAPLALLNEWAGGVYRIPLPYSVAFDVSSSEKELGVSFTAMDAWVRETGDWMTEFYRNAPQPSWYSSRRKELQWKDMGHHSRKT